MPQVVVTRGLRQASLLKHPLPRTVDEVVRIYRVAVLGGEQPSFRGPIIVPRVPSERVQGNLRQFDGALAARRLGRINVIAPDRTLDLERSSSEVYVFEPQGQALALP